MHSPHKLGSRNLRHFFQFEVIPQSHPKQDPLSIITLSLCWSVLFGHIRGKCLTKTTRCLKLHSTINILNSCFSFLFSIFFFFKNKSDKFFVCCLFFVSLFCFIFVEGKGLASDKHKNLIHRPTKDSSDSKPGTESWLLCRAEPPHPWRSLLQQGSGVWGAVLCNAFWVLSLLITGDSEAPLGAA